jgi:hypothetical protein
VIKLRRRLQGSGASFKLTALAVVVLALASIAAALLLQGRDDAWARAQLFAAATFAFFIAAVVNEICNPAPARIQRPMNAAARASEQYDLVKKAEDLLTRIRADYTQVGANLTTLLGFVATGGGVIALSNGGGTAVTPLIESAAVAILAVLVLCVLGLRPEHHATTTTTAEEFDGWLNRAKHDPAAFNYWYVQDIFHKCDRYERFRRVRRAYYIYAGWCFIVALTAVGLNAIHPDCSLTTVPSAAKPCADAKAAAAARR